MVMLSPRLPLLPVQASLGVPYGLVTHGDIFDRPRGTYDPRLTWFYKRVTPTAYSKANLIVALSPYMHALAQKRGAAKNSIRVIPNGIDPSELGLSVSFTPSPPLGIGSPLRVLFVGRLSIEKGVDTLLQACDRLVQRNIPFQLRLVGDGPLRSQLQAMVNSLGLNDAQVSSAICRGVHWGANIVTATLSACRLAATPSPPWCLRRLPLEDA